MKKFFIIAAIFVVLLVSGTALASDFYLHDHGDYWWYMPKNPNYSAVIPNTGQHYIQRDVFGQKILEITWDNGAVSMEIASVPNQDVATVRKSIEERFKPLVRNVNVISDGEITTSNNLRAHFYGYEATGANNRRVMLRSVFFKYSSGVVYLAMYLDAAKYQGNLREYWLRAVNDFEW